MTRMILENQSTDSTGGSIVSECWENGSDEGLIY